MEKSTEVNAKAGKPNILMKILDKSSFWTSVWFERAAMVGIVGIIVVTLIDVIGAKIFHKPLAAGTEAVYFLQIIAIAGTLAFAQIENRHVRLEFVDSLPRPIRGSFSFISSILGLALFIMLAWKSFAYAQSLETANEVTSASRIPIYPFAIWVGISCIPMCLVLLNSLVKSIVEVIRR
jgi:TRAP-type transport system small permease protein